ncbi:MAG: TIR domain-containing protein [Anaerolineales bacterium]|nr:TIR domain-containing protein [Anaerolineales bacterium]
MTNHVFISYSGADGLDFATRLADELQGQHPFIDVWFDKRELSPSARDDWDDQLANAIKTCKCLTFVMSEDSAADGSVCKEEWTWALKYKKPVITLRKDKSAEVPFRLNNRQHVDFVSDFEIGIAQLRTAIARLDSPAGMLDELKYRLADAQRDLRRATAEEQPRIEAEITELKEKIAAQEKVAANPKAAEQQTQKNIEAGLERERQPEKPVTAKTSTKFINPPPGIAPYYFQDREVETIEIMKFLNDDAQRLMTIVGRGGVGKTAMVCRLLKALENSQLLEELKDKFEIIKIDGIVYLSESGSHRVNFPNIFAGLSKLLPSETANKLDALYKDPKTSVKSKMDALLEHFQGERVLLLLDNFEPVVDSETQEIREGELDEALCALLRGPHHMVNALITTRVAPRELNLCEPGRQRVLTLDEGLESSYAENILREMDEDGKLGLKVRDESDPLLQRAREKTRGYPRALEALFAILSSDRYTTLEELLEMPLPENVVEALVGEAFSRLDATAQKVMQALAVYNRPVPPAAVDYLLQPHLPEIDSAPVLNRLVNMHFVRREAGRYYLHPVDHDYAFAKIPVLEQSAEDSNVEIYETEDERALAEIQRELDVLRGEITKLEFTQHDLLNRAADYFAQARKPRAEWKKLEDLSAQLAEFDLRCAAGDFDTAASVLLEIDFDYLLWWGHYRLMIDLHEKLQGKIKDLTYTRRSIGNLGQALDSIGKINQAISNYKNALAMAKEAKNRYAEGIWLNNLGNTYYYLGKIHEYLDLQKQSLHIAREVGDKTSEAISLNNIGEGYAILGQDATAIDYYEQALVT